MNKLTEGTPLQLRVPGPDGEKLNAARRRGHEAYSELRRLLGRKRLRQIIGRRGTYVVGFLDGYMMQQQRLDHAEKVREQAETLRDVAWEGQNRLKAELAEVRDELDTLIATPAEEK